MTVEAMGLAEAVEELQVLVNGDGARLELIEGDTGAGRLHLRLDLDAVECIDCVLPPDALADIIGDSVRRRTASDIEVIVDDPRRTDG
jgi:hypothetical protein